MRSIRLGTVLLVLVASLAAWRLWRLPYSASNLEISPDSVEYAVAADRFASHLGYSISIDGVPRPPRYPPWFSVGLLAPVLLFANGELGAAILPVFVLGVMAVVAAFFVGRHLAGEWGAVGAALALLFNHAFAGTARVVLTDVPALAFGLAACWLYVRDAPPTRSRPVLAGVLTAFGFALRPEALAVLLPFAWRIVKRESRPARALLALVLPSLAVAAATAWYDAATFGSWRRTGYHYWCPVPYEFPGLVLGLRYLKENLERLLTAPRIAVLVLGAAGALVLLARNRDAARRILLFLGLGALPGTLLHLIYFYPETRFHLFLLALASVIGGAAVGSIVGGMVRGRLWPLAPILALASLVPRAPDPPPYQRITADILARETPRDAVIVSGLDPVFLEPYLLRGSSRTLVPASRSVEYASKLVAETPLRSIDPPPRGPTDHRAPGLVRAGAVDPCAVVATESPERLVGWVREGRPVFIDVSFLPKDAPLGRILDPSLVVVPNPHVPWLGEVRLR